MPTTAERSFLGFTPLQVGDFGLALSIGGHLTQAVGAYYSAKAQQAALKSQALDLEYRQSMAAINARAAEQDAQVELEAGSREVGRVGLTYRQVKAQQRVATAAGGVQAGVGSAAEVQASIDYAKETDQITINSNAVRAANASRLRATGLLAEGRMAGVGAENARKAASQISPVAFGAGSLISGAGQVSREWVVNERSSARYRSGAS